MEFEALWIGVNDRTVDNFDLEVVREIPLERSMLFQHYAESIEMRHSFQGGMANLIFTCVFPNVFQASAGAIKPRNPADFLCAQELITLVKQALKSRLDTTKELRFLTGIKNWTCLKVFKNGIKKCFKKYFKKFKKKN